MEEKQFVQARNELVTHELKDILRAHPHWLVRKGNTIMILILLLGVFITWLIPYPDTIDGSGWLIDEQNSVGDHWNIKVSNNQLKGLVKGRQVAVNVHTAETRTDFAFKGVVNNILSAGSQKDSSSISVSVLNEQRNDLIIPGNNPYKVQIVLNDKRLLETLSAPLKNVFSMNK